MDRSEGVRDRLLLFYDRLSAGDVEAFEDLVSADASALVIGTAPGEWVTERERMRFGFETEGFGLEPGKQPTAWEEGSVGWASDEPSFVFPDGSRMLTRMTTIWRWEDGVWRLVHMHASVGVPDDEVMDLQKRWLA